MLKKIYLLVGLTLITSCSVVGEWWYINRLDSYLNNYFFEYANFSNEQKDFIRSTTKEYKIWHFENELPKYIKVLEDIRELNKNISSKDLQDLYLRGSVLFRSSNNFFIPRMIDLSKRLNEKQVDQIENHFEEILVKREKVIQEVDKEIFKKDIIKNSTSGFKRLGIRLNSNQKRIIEKFSHSIQDIRKESIEAQRFWNKGLVEILRNRKNEEFDESLTEYLRGVERMGGRDYKAKDEKNRLIFFEMTADIISSLDKNQNKNYQKRIDYYIYLIEKILDS
ncbi:MAG: DUF6279 family lipoprotein [Pseudomonadota bacterium]|nr:DUF6279 family lipoprotein [Pseudomonadota bacterium]|tara:strand:- start:2571 stop:3410 length:840 start_codon:yes stop_codon:yes gene_type:complete